MDGGMNFEIALKDSKESGFLAAVNIVCISENMIFA